MPAGAKAQLGWALTSAATSVHAGDMIPRSDRFPFPTIEMSPDRRSKWQFMTCDRVSMWSETFRAGYKRSG